jgi:hypothetical protein
MKTIITILSIAILSTSLSAQDAKDAATKMDAFASKTGVIVKFEDTVLEPLKLSFGVAQTKIRKITSGGEVGFFLRISNEGKYGTKTASIEYSDLIEIQKAMYTLQAESESDRSISDRYIENKFVTEDDFQLGYYVSNGKINWYMMLTRFGDGNTIFLRDENSVVNLINDAIQKIESMQ